jgi:hypothetical protein
MLPLFKYCKVVILTCNFYDVKFVIKHVYINEGLKVEYVTLDLNFELKISNVEHQTLHFLKKNIVY